MGRNIRIKDEGNIRFNLYGHSIVKGKIIKDDIIKGVFKFLCGNGNYEQEIAYRISKAFLKPYSEKEIKDIFEKNDMETIKRRTEFVILYELIELCKGISKMYTVQVNARKILKK